MDAETIQTAVTAVITPKGEDLLRGGHVWVFADEVTGLSGNAVDGDIVTVRSAKGKYLGSGFYNSASKIRIRVFSKNANDVFNEAFWERRVRYAVDYRKSVMGDDFSFCRLIFGEADSFPGLVIDRFGDLLVSQVGCLGIERVKNHIYSAVVRILREYGQTVTAFFERNDDAVRTLEGMDSYCAFWQGEQLAADYPSPLLVTENGITYEADFRSGQKTGYFLDQKYNRLAIRPVARGRNVLDCCTHTGAFALNAARAGAAHVTGVDISHEAVELCRRNAERNGLSDTVDFVCADVFDYLSELKKNGKSPFDFIILDPPAFTKSRSTLKNAIKGYREINALAMQLLPRGGYLATCSCSHFMTETYFKQMLHNAAEDAHVSLRQIEQRQQAPDHPILWNVPETDYLKFFIFQIV